MSRTKIAISVILIIVACLSLYIFSDCGACISENDYKFMNKIKSRLDKLQDSEKVSAIHPGDWTKVCVYPGGHDQNLASNWDPRGQDLPHSVIINGAHPFITEKYDESAVVFYYPSNRIEIFRMLPDKMVYKNSSDSSCASKNAAYFVVLKKIKSAPENNANDDPFSGHYFEIGLEER